MILVADSGSTKCDWLIINKGESLKTHTMGFNPFFHNTALVESELLKNVEFQKIKDQVKEVHFYGAGCSSIARNLVIHNALSAVFTNADINVDHDLTGAAVATCETKPGIACIIGTGSNSCYFDGDKTVENVPALGYVLGDEGSGSYFGKILLSEYLYNRLPQDLHDAFAERFSVNKEEIFTNVYNQPNPNVYLASFMRFVSDHRDHPYFKEMIYNGLAKFVNIHVWCYDNFREVPVHFVGSIAYYFREVLEEVAKNHRFTIGNIEKRPVDAIAKFYANFTTA
jgi:N-acetylglucosamine kinase-like BadF-type ATPase